MANVTLVKLAAFYNEGARGLGGGAAQNDKVWGVALVGSTLVNFWGRRNGKMKFKTYTRNQEGKVMATYTQKIGGRTSGDVYTAIPVTNAILVKSLAPTLEKDLVSHYYSDMSLGKLNTRH